MGRQLRSDLEVGVPSAKQVSFTLGFGGRTRSKSAVGEIARGICGLNCPSKDLRSDYKGWRSSGFVSVKNRSVEKEN